MLSWVRALTKIGIIQKEGTVTMHKLRETVQMYTKREDQECYWGKKETSNEVDKPLDKESTANGRGRLDK